MERLAEVAWIAQGLLDEGVVSPLPALRTWNSGRSSELD